MENLTYEEFLILLKEKSDASVVKAFQIFRSDLESSHVESRLRFSLKETALDIQLKPPRQKPTVQKRIKEWISTVAFTVRGKRSFNKIGVCFTMMPTEIELRKYGYPPQISQEFYDGLAAIDGRLKVGQPLIQQLPLRDLNAETLSKIARVIDKLISKIEGETLFHSPSVESDIAGESDESSGTVLLRDDHTVETTEAGTGGVDIDLSGGGKSGFIYILTNAAMSPDCLKIGMTTRTSEQRASEISNGTGVPCRFQVAFEEHVEDCHETERILHRKLKKYRMQANREFFSLPLKDAIRIVQEVANLNTSCTEVEKIVPEARS